MTQQRTDVVFYEFPEDVRGLVFWFKNGVFLPKRDYTEQELRNIAHNIKAYGGLPDVPFGEQLPEEYLADPDDKFEGSPELDAQVLLVDLELRLKWLADGFRRCAIRRLMDSTQSPVLSNGCIGATEDIYKVLMSIQYYTKELVEVLPDVTLPEGL